MSRFRPVQLCPLSSHITSCLEEVVTFPLSSVTCQSYQIFVPGGSEPDLSISHVQVTFTELAGLKLGNASAEIVPQVRFSTPYSRITFSIVPVAVEICALKAILRGNVIVVPLSVMVVCEAIDALETGINVNTALISRAGHLSRCVRCISARFSIM